MDFPFLQAAVQLPKSTLGRVPKLHYAVTGDWRGATRMLRPKVRAPAHSSPWRPAPFSKVGCSATNACFIGLSPAFSQHQLRFASLLPTFGAPPDRIGQHYRQ